MKHKILFLTAQRHFDRLGWNEGLKGFQSQGHCSSGSLTRFLLTAWLSSSDLEHLGNLLQIELDDVGRSAKVVSPDWMLSLRALKRKDDSAPNLYALGPRKHLKRDGALLVQERLKYLAGTANLGETHWISFIILAESRQILIGDSMLAGGEAALQKGEWGEVIETLQWWIHQSHVLFNEPYTPYEVFPLVVQHQSDSHSCGVFAYNSLQSFLNPRAHSCLLVESMRRPRAEMFVALVEHHFSHASVSCTSLRIGFMYSQTIRLHLDSYGGY
jgi:hypothetical protein